VIKKMCYGLVAVGILFHSVASPVLVETSDGQQVKIEDYLARLSTVLTKHLEAGKPQEGKETLQVQASSDTMSSLVRLMQALSKALKWPDKGDTKYDALNKTKFAVNFDWKSPEKCIQLLNAADNLGVELLIELAARELAQKRDILEPIKQLPKHLQEVVAKHYVILNKKQMAGINFTPGLSFDDLYEHRATSVLPDLMEPDKLNLSNLYLTSLDGLTKKYTNLREINLAGNRLKSLPEGVFNGLTSLQVLRLDHNQLTSLSAGVFNGLSLQTLGLHNNKLTTLPEGVFSGLTSLKELWLDHNDLAGLSAGVFNGLSLQTLGLHNNKLTTLPEGVFSGLTSLQNLGLKNNQLSRQEITAVRMALPRANVSADEGQPQRGGRFRRFMQGRGI